MRLPALVLSLSLVFTLAPSMAQRAYAQHEAAPAHDVDPATAPLGAEAPHPATAHGGEGHDEGGSVIENWWSWDYGTGKSHHHPPFGFAIINFLIYLYILKRLFWDSLQGFLLARHQGVRRALDEAAELRKKADGELKKYEERLQGLDGEVAALLGTMRREAEAERGRIIEAAQAQATALQEDAEAQIRAEIARARAALHRQVGLAAVEAAEAILRQKVQLDDHKHLVEEYVARVESLSGVATEELPYRPTAR